MLSERHLVCSASLVTRHSCGILNKVVHWMDEVIWNKAYINIKCFLLSELYRNNSTFQVRRRHFYSTLNNQIASKLFVKKNNWLLSSTKEASRDVNFFRDFSRPRRFLIRDDYSFCLISRPAPLFLDIPLLFAFLGEEAATKSHTVKGPLLLFFALF